MDNLDEFLFESRKDSLLRECKSTIEQLEEELSHQKSLKSSSMKKSQVLLEEYTSLQETYETLQSQFEQSSLEFQYKENTLKEKATKAEQQANSLESQVKDLLANLSYKNYETEQLKSQISSLEEEVQNLVHQNTALNSKFQEACKLAQESQSQLQLAQQENKDLNKQIHQTSQNLKNHYQTNRQKSTELQKQLCDLEQLFTHSKANYEKTLQEKTQLIGKLQKELSELRIDLQNSILECKFKESVETQTHPNNNWKKKLSADIGKISSQHTQELQELFEAQYNQIQSLARENSYIKQHYTKLLLYKCEEVDYLNQENSELKRILRNSSR